MNWCSIIFATLDASHATDVAIRDAIEFYLKSRAKRAKESA